ncbi:outer membrane protein assembly factor BamC [Crenobacter sp. SG2303]|uniref:Outer membrane protein assembly factor BamC n=1 Tax=Crenobacter oryzisoli TaxID=3056844 RepID=A0ABT7XHW5_9NEIS|nr:outer membrane protein assembly factor BamC [Crenobacter sp. SG2303]MDN0073363.1 outer membrane protein assembly factor BamC [Crenobacter sp. SG2303]
MKRNASVALLLSASLLAACSSTSEPLDKKLDYKTDGPKPQGASLEVPPDLTAPQIQNKYTIPGSGTASLAAMDKAEQQQAKAAPVPSADNSGVLSKVDNVAMQRDGNQRWLLVKGKSAAELWPQLKAFWQDNGFVIKSEEQDIGLMETDWAENRAKLPNDGLRKLMDAVGIGGVYSTPERDKFRIRLETTANGIEVYFSHRGMYETYIDEGKSETMWQPRPSDPQLEAAFLGRFMMRLGLNEDQARQEVKQADAPVKNARAQIEGDTLQVVDGFDRAWRRVGLALDRIGLTVNDRDRSKGLYFVKPAKNELDPKGKESGGFWSSLAFWKSSDDKDSTSIKEGAEYRVQVKDAGEGRSQVQLLDSTGSTLNNSLSKTVLSKLQSELQ